MTTQNTAENTARTDVLSEVVAMLAEVVGEDFLLEQTVGPDTTFNADLALESIEFVALAERLQRHYGARIEFAAFIAGLDLDQIMAMTVGDLTSYIEARLAASPDGAPDASAAFA
ncbi:acyl carrier protein [Actinomadura harenae]|uniref:Acyl carrier protein n=1 Tax=Actinomadura harenae TaxID=2483351 RepID=A0A3M2KX18_9ACTN|nr:acyl carrier protein [Actinomadura harenae]RMI29791.1 acyl carrier protein [Actinomadura harenae]